MYVYEWMFFNDEDVNKIFFWRFKFVGVNQRKLMNWKMFHHDIASESRRNDMASAAKVQSEA